MQRKNLLWVGLYAVAMAYLEAAVVIYLRRLFGVSDLVRDVPPFDPTLAPIEVGRELSTLVMLLAVGWAAGRTRQGRIGFIALAFGLWDLWYYVWLKALINWPASLLEPDILFLIPLPWWGPVAAPALIAALVAAGGALTVLWDDRGRAVRLLGLDWVALAVGAGLALYSFVADALAALPASPEELNHLRPSSFDWPIYLIGLALIAWALLRAAWLRPRQAQAA